MFSNLGAQLSQSMRRLSVPLARVAIFIVYFWFGILKVYGLSPAEPLVHELFNRTIHFISFDTFYVAFAWFEVLIGVLFLFPRLTRLAFVLLVVHLITTVLPLYYLPSTVWQSFFVPTLEGQYIIKNILILSCGVTIVGHSRS